MKIALCLSGQLRFVEQGFNEVIYPYILAGNSIDVFIHSWDINTQVGTKFLAGNMHPVGDIITSDLVDQTLQLYAPTNYKIEPQIEFPVLDWKSNHMPGFYSKNVYSMFYSIYQANKLKYDHEVKNNFKYDLVIRNRFDTKLDSVIDFGNLDTNVITVPTGCFNPVNGYVDCFAIANSTNIDMYSDLYNHLDQYLNTAELLCGEYILKRHIDNNHIPVVSLMWHSLFR